MNVLKLFNLLTFPECHLREKSIVKELRAF